MAAKNIEEAVEAMAAELLAGQDVVELVDVEYVNNSASYCTVS